jgi:hypothetical protein
VSAKTKAVAEMAERAKKRPKTLGQRALVVGISNYPAPITKLPAVSADVREIAKLLGSKNGTFSGRNVTLLRDSEAIRTKIIAALKQVLAGAQANDTVFVYLAGHGAIDTGDYYFVPYDTNVGALASTGLPLAQIRDLFDQSPSHQVFLWLDFCHSGGILARSSAGRDDREIISRTLAVVQGKGKVILAACTESQESWEDSRIGHGLFTDALLRGLKGEAEAGGEVTANSLFDFIDREIGSHHQRPMYFGKLTGRIVLMNYKRGTGTTPTTKAPAKKPPAKRLKATTGRATGTLVMLDRSFFPAQSVQQGQDGTFTVRIAPATADQEADLEALRTRRHGDSLPFAARNDAHLVRVRGCEKDLSGKRAIWTLTLAPEERGFGGNGMEATYNDGGNVYTPEDVARLRARLLLLNEQPPGASGRGHSGYSLVAGAVAGSGKHQARECVIRSTHARYGKSSAWREMARLQAIFLLKATGTVDHVLGLTIGPVRGGEVAVTFRGRRPPRYTGHEPIEIEVSGTCPIR